MAEPGKVVITGGAGFIGTNLAARILADGRPVAIVDNFARPGTRANAAWLTTLNANLEFLEVDVRDYESVRRAVQGATAVFHLAAQVAVTTSVADPRMDFDVNAVGTFNVLEAVRNDAPGAFLAYSSTNKVYGGLDDQTIAKDGSRYVQKDAPNGVPESRSLDFHSPYGCSKGAGDQYVRDYARIYGLRSVVFRQACIYGPHQFGNEDQGWVAHFMIQALKGRPIRIYGDGLQVRDVLHVDDLITCYQLAESRIERIQGEVFNLGGGPQNSLSLLELIGFLERTMGKAIEYNVEGWRPGDQRVYVSDISKAAALLGWKPSVSLTRGLESLMGWLREHHDQIP